MSRVSLRSKLRTHKLESPLTKHRALVEFRSFCSAVATYSVALTSRMCKHYNHKHAVSTTTISTGDPPLMLSSHMSARGAVRVDPVTGKIARIDSSVIPAGMHRDGSLLLPGTYVNAAKELGLGGAHGTQMGRLRCAYYVVCIVTDAHALSRFFLRLRHVRPHQITEANRSRGHAAWRISCYRSRLRENRRCCRLCRHQTQ